MIYLDSVRFSKFSPPALSGILPRKRLFSLIDSNSNRPIIWICGPPGSGKTTLAASYLKEKKLQSLWYRVDEGDADIGNFFYYMGMAVKKTATRSKHPTLILTPEYLTAISTFTRRFFQDIFGRLKSPSVLVFDNYHEVPPDSLFHTVIRDGLDEIPDGVRIIITSRSNPPATMARFLARDMAETIGWDALRLTEDESKKIIGSRSKSGSCSEETVRHLYRKSDGWAAGLVLLLKEREVVNPDESVMSEALVKGHENQRDKNVPPILNLHPDRWGFLTPLERFSGEPDFHTPDVVFDYLAGEMFDKTDSKTKEFLLKTAFLPTNAMMTAKMAEKLTGMADAGHILSSLYSDHCFTGKSVHPEPVFQYHSLFREFLLSRTGKFFTQEAITEIKRRSAILLEESGQFEDAVSLFTEARDWGGAVRLICNQAYTLVNQGRGQTLSAWLDRLPKEIIDNTPWLLYWKGVCNLLINPEDGLPFFERAFQIFSSNEDIAGVSLSGCGAIDSIFYTFRDFSRLDPWIDKMIDEMTKQRDRCSSFPSSDLKVVLADAVETRVIYNIFRSLLFRNPCHGEFHKWAEKALHLFQQSKDLPFRMEFIFHLVFYCHLSGDFRRAFMLLEFIDESSRHLPETTSPISILGWQAARAFYFWMTVSIEKCLEAVNEGLKVSQETGVHILDYVLLGWGISAALTSGDMSTSGKLLKSMASSLDMGGHNDRAFYHFVAAWEALLKKDRPLALQHAGDSLRQVEELGGEWQKIPAQLMLAQVLHEQGDDQKAEEHLASIRRFALQSKSIFFEYIYLLTVAQFAMDRGDENACLNSLRKAMAIGREKGLLNFWGWRSDVMAKLCAKALDSGIEGEYVQGLIRSRGLLPDNQHIYSEKWPWPLKIYTLGRFGIVKDGRPLSNVQFNRKARQKPLRLLKAIIALGGRSVSEAKLTDQIWGTDVDGDDAHGSFETTLHRLRTLLRVDNKAIRFRESLITLDPAYCWVDIWAFERITGEADTAIQREGYTDNAILMVTKGIEMYHGHFLSSDTDEPWTESIRERVKSKFLRHLSGLSCHWMKTGETEKAVECFNKGLETDNTSEELYQHLMTCYITLGRRADAAAAYQRCKKILHAELGVPPSSKTEALYKKVMGSGG